jgi:hypothetical protein
MIGRRTASDARQIGSDRERRTRRLSRSQVSAALFRWRGSVLRADRVDAVDVVAMLRKAFAGVGAGWAALSSRRTNCSPPKQRHCLRCHWFADGRDGRLGCHWHIQRSVKPISTELSGNGIKRRSRSDCPSGAFVTCQKPLKGANISGMCLAGSERLRPIITDTERIGALAVRVAKSASRKYTKHVIPEEARECFADGGEVAIMLANSARQVLAIRDSHTTAQLHQRTP